MITEKDLQKHELVLLNWRRDPVRFVREAFGAEPEKWQADALYGIRDNDRLAIRSGHGVGKSAFLAWAIIWWLLTRYPAKVACTANTSTQLSDVLWGELDKWVRKLPEGVKQLLELKQDYLVLAADPKQSFAVARTARKEQPEAFQGYHSKNMLFVIDEASGVDDIIFEVGRGAMSSHGAKTLMTGNPTRTSGYFFDAFHSMRKFWKTMHVSCMDSTQVSEQYIEECKEEYGEDSSRYRVRVLGEFPEEGDNVLIPIHLVESALIRDVALIPDSGEVWGLDVARFGDDESALAKRRSNHLMEPVKTWRGVDLMQTAGRVKREYDDAKMKPEAIFVDAVGMGAGVADRLSEQGLPAVAINVSESPAVGEKFNKLRDELWWLTREWFRSLEVKIPPDPKLESELTLVRYGFTSSGKTKVESKDELKKRTAKSLTQLGKSPDRADALCLTFATGVMTTRKQRPIVYPSLGIV